MSRSAGGGSPGREDTGEAVAAGDWSDILVGTPDEVARRLLGMLLVGSDGRALRLVEVEAYGGRDDPASHAYRGRSARNSTMWGPPGRLYVYLSYGVHWCANVTCGSDGRAAAVLLRAGEPVAGVEAMRSARWAGRPAGPDRDLARGPGRLGRAMGIDASDDGADLTTGDRGLVVKGAPGSGGALVAAPRVGVTRGADRQWRFVLAGSPALSRPVPAGVPADGSPAPAAGRGARSRR